MPTVESIGGLHQALPSGHKKVLPGKVWQVSALEVMVVPREGMGARGTARSLVWIGHKERRGDLDLDR